MVYGIRRGASSFRIGGTRTFATPVTDRTGACGDLTAAGRKVHRLKALMALPAQDGLFLELAAIRARESALMSHLRKEHDRV